MGHFHAALKSASLMPSGLNMRCGVDCEITLFITLDGCHIFSFKKHHDSQAGVCSILIH
jgi:hypothetical protein